MSHWQKIRNEARRLRTEVCERAGRDGSALLSASDLIESTVAHLELILCPEATDSANLHGALALIDDDVIHFDNSLDEWFKQYCIAHEIGHHELHHKSIHCSEADIENLETDEELPTATSLVIGYGPNERREREANLFALEFLLPAGVLRHAFVEGNLKANEIAAAAKMPVSMVERQLARALLTEEQSSATEDRGRPKVELNESQKKAIEADQKPTLISAGPGTGKTETLIQRINRLLEKGVAAEKILALTFSHKATEEMRERISQDRPVDARRMTIMTFHSFGLEILRKFWEETGLDKDSNLLDPIDAILMLEENIADLNLEHYMMLSNPEFYLPALLGAISRAKDELCSPAKFRSLAESMLTNAAGDEETLAAEKALEAARVYAFYQQKLDDERLLDFGDLIFKAVNLLETNETAREFFQNRFDAVLVDEFQDINRASGVLLNLLSGDGKGLWAVGDLRQSIYRWRGASPQNIRAFESEYKGAERLSLETNYRSDKKIVDLFGAFAKQMIAGDEFSDWDVFRDVEAVSGAITMTVGNKFEDEISAIAKQIKDRKADGVDFKEQAIICRTHKQLADLAAGLGKRGIPVLYLGKLFERPEIRDLLALLELRTSNGPHALLRVARFEDYKISDEDLDVILTELSAEGLSFPKAFEEVQLEGKISDTGLKSWQKLVSHLRLDEPGVSPAAFLNRFLFTESVSLPKLIEDDSPAGKQKLIAIYQFLHFAKSLDTRFVKKGERKTDYFLKHVRRLAWFGEQTNLAQIPPAANNFDAVRLITVHGAKGLEFDTVYLPYLASGKVPGRKFWEACPAPSGMIEGAEDQHLEEEECLFFVAMSRAKSRLNLSRADYYGERASKESDFLKKLVESLPAANVVKSEDSVLDETETEKPDNRVNFYMAEINRYDRCPRQFYYYHTKGLKGQDDVSPYVKFHRCLYQVIGELNGRKAAGSDISNGKALEVLEEKWSEANIDAHPYAPFYKSTAVEITERIAAQVASTPTANIQPELTLELSNGTVKIRPDAVSVVGDEVVVTKYKTGKATKTPTEAKFEDMATHIAAKQNFEPRNVISERVYLSDDSTHQLNIGKVKENNHIKKSESHISGINARKFEPDTDQRTVPRLPLLLCVPGRRAEGIISRGIPPEKLEPSKNTQRSDKTDKTRYTNWEEFKQKNPENELGDTIRNQMEFLRRQRLEFTVHSKTNLRFFETSLPHQHVKKRIGLGYFRIIMATGIFITLRERSTFRYNRKLMDTGEGIAPITALLLKRVMSIANEFANSN